MTIYVVGYDLHPSRGETYDDLLAALGKYGGSWHCIDSTWLIKTDQTAVQVRDNLKQHVKSDDQLLVVAYAPHNSAWFGFTGECQKWLKNNM